MKTYHCRWYTYLNSDFKKGGWSPEEDVLLCEVIGVFPQFIANLLDSKLLYINAAKLVCLSNTSIRFVLELCTTIFVQLSVSQLTCFHSMSKV